MVPKDLPWLDGMVTPCGALAPEAVEEIEDGCASRFEPGRVPNDCAFCPGWFWGPDGSEGVCAKETHGPANTYPDIAMTRRLVHM